MNWISALATSFIVAVLIRAYASMGFAIWTVGLIVLVLNWTLWLIRFLIIDDVVFRFRLLFVMQLYGSELARLPLSVVECSVSLIAEVREFLKSRIPIWNRRETTFSHRNQ